MIIALVNSSVFHTVFRYMFVRKFDVYVMHLK
jgi:hypothetical protein